MALASTVWPDEPVPESMNGLYLGFFQAVDTNVPDTP
jgi:hypothetical protein